MMRRSVYLASAALLIWSARGSGQDPRLNKLNASLRNEIQAVIDSAAALGLPTEPLKDRAFQGKQSGVADSVIVAAVRARSARLRVARDVLGASASEPEIIAAADALSGGIRAETIREIRRRRPSGSLLVPLSLLADFVTRRVHADTAARVVLTLTAVGFGDDDLNDFRRMVERDIAVGMLPTAAAVTRANAFTEASTLGSTRDNAATAPPGSNPPTRPIPPTRP